MEDYRSVGTIEDAESASMAVLRAVAEEEGVDVLDLQEPLAYTIDSGALDTLAQSRNCQISFEYLGHEITVVKDGDIVVD